MIVFIAGPMSGKENYNTEAFNKAEELLSYKGYIVLNPARLPKGMRDEQYLPITIAMVEQADMICLLEGWEDSYGTKAELAYATRQHKKVAVLKGQNLIDGIIPEL